jgi:hypothetical protein
MTEIQRTPQSLLKCSATFAMVLSAGLILGCGAPSPEGETLEMTTSALSLTNARILGFEAPTADWSVVSGGHGTITASPIRSEGLSSLAINAQGYVQLRSVRMSSLGSDVSATVRYDVMLPQEQPNPSWYGDARLIVNLPSQGLSNVFIGQVELTGRPLSQFTTVQFTLPANIVSALRGTYSDLQLTAALNVPPNATGTYRIDNLRFTSSAPSTITQLSSDTFTNSTSQHATQVEPASFAFGSTIVTTAQSGRFQNGGASDIAFATSRDSGATWTTGNLPGLTTYSGGTFDAVSNASVVFDARHNVWIVASLVVTSSGDVSSGVAIMANRSTDGGLTWSRPVLVTSAGIALDKSWITCDNAQTSPFYGHCYVEWDDYPRNDLIQMNTSTDGGLTWGPPLATAASDTGMAGQPLVQPNGTVIVPIARSGTMAAFRSTNGGSSWTAITTIAMAPFHPEAGGLRPSTFPSAQIDSAGKVYVVWPDCSFRTGCTANDLVMSTSTNGTTWSPVVRIPIDPTTSSVDHFLPGLGVDVTTAGATAHLGLTYYFYPVSNCTAATCQLEVGFISSVDGGSTWGTPTTLAGPMNLSWLPSAIGGQMLGDYISTAFSAGTAHSFFVVASAPTGGVFNQALFTARN